MGFCNSLAFSLFLLISLHFTTTSTHAAIFSIKNNCPYTVWAAAMPGGGRRLEQGKTWTMNQPAGTTSGRIWARTGCSFDSAGRGWCESGDCGRVLECQASGQHPVTVAEYELNQPYAENALNEFGNWDYYDISLVEGFNMPMEFSTTSGGCHGITCTADINGQCPNELRAPGGCNNPCTVFTNCGPTNYSRFFKDRCPEAYSHNKDDQIRAFSCPSGTNYKVVFCSPKRSSGLKELLLVCDDKEL